MAPFNARLRFVHTERATLTHQRSLPWPYLSTPEPIKELVTLQTLSTSTEATRARFVIATEIAHAFWQGLREQAVRWKIMTLRHCSLRRADSIRKTSL